MQETTNSIRAEEVDRWVQTGGNVTTPEGQYMVGISFLKGVSVADTDGQINVIFHQDTNAAIEWLRKSAEQNYLHAQYALGHIYAQRANWSNRYYIVAANWFKKAEANNPSQDVSEHIKRGLPLAQLEGAINNEIGSCFRREGSPEEAGHKMANLSGLLVEVKKKNVVEVPEDQLDTPIRPPSPASPNSITRETNSSKCFVATAIYGSCETEEVQILRRFRDIYLLPKPSTAWMVGVYYNVGPYIAKGVNKWTWARSFVKVILDRIVRLVKCLLESPNFRK